MFAAIAVLAIVLIVCLEFSDQIQNEEIFNKWKERLYNKRPFRRTDKVCERHFHKNEILTHWDHIIDGSVYQLAREKPKLKEDAVPSLNLPDINGIGRGENIALKSKISEPQKRRVGKSKPVERIETEPVLPTEVSFRQSHLVSPQ